jgi:hypothetical protein
MVQFVAAASAATFSILFSSFLVPAAGLSQLQNERMGLRAIVDAIPGLKKYGAPHAFFYDLKTTSTNRPIKSCRLGADTSYTSR